jgi:hypothetical protein
MNTISNLGAFILEGSSSVSYFRTLLQILFSKRSFTEIIGDDSFFSMGTCTGTWWCMYDAFIGTALLERGPVQALRRRETAVENTQCGLEGFPARLDGQGLVPFLVG